MRDRSLGSTIRLKFTTTDSNGAPVAPSSAFVAADFRIYKDGSATEKTTTNGITVTSPFDSVVGRHLIEIDTSNATGDVGFWASGSAYFVELNTAKTVNSQAVSGLEVGSFSLELQTADVRKFGGTAVTQSGGRPEVNVSHIGGDAQSLADLKDFADAGYDPTANAVTAVLDSASVTAVQSGLALEATSQSIKAKTDNLPSDPADQSAVEAAITAATSPLATPAQVNAQVVDALSVDTYAELTAPPAATSSLKDKITWLFMYARNKVTQTATQRKLYRDDGSTVAGTSGTTDDGTTFTKGEDA